MGWVTVTVLSTGLEANSPFGILFFLGEVPGNRCFVQSAMALLFYFTYKHALGSASSPDSRRETKMEAEVS